jgi:hypothetical protein
MSPCVIRAFSPVFTEHLETWAPEEAHDRVRALEPYTVYGPQFRRVIIELLRDMSHAFRVGHDGAGYRYLEAAERVASQVEVD